MKEKSSKNYLIDIIIGIVALFIYFTFQEVEVSILNFLHIDVETMSMTFKVIYLIICEIFEMLILIALFYKKLKVNIEDIKKNHLTYFRKYFKYWLLILMIMMGSNLIIMLFTQNQTSANEQAVRDLLIKSPIYAYFSGVIFAPVVEELIFRRGLRNIFKNDTLFILISGLIFGGLHVITGYSSLTDLLYLIPYCTPGIVFAYILVKTDNVLVPMSIHFIHNGILIALQMFAYLFLS